jgi:GH35 family endo-1,4-beta-xylanase/DNA polymerase III epsilon subunit-like protein
MNKLVTFAIIVLCSLTLSSQDTYHQDLITKFAEEYQLDQPTYVFFNTETANLEAFTSYGNVSIETTSVEGFDFSKQSSIEILSLGENPWNTGYLIKSKTAIAKDDILVFTFWAKKSSSNSEVKFFVENAITFDKEFYEILNFSSDWDNYFIAIKASQDYPIDNLSVGFHLGFIEQEFELAGLTGFNFGPIDIEDVPSSYNSEAYEGIEDDAPWRAAAAARIENIRKSDLTILVKDGNGNPISDAEIKIEMLEHEFQFGSAFVGCRTPGGRCFDEKYLEKVLDLDGEGHQFNSGVTENVMKWDGWEEEWFASPSQTEDAIEYYSSKGIEMRGHTLFWPGYQHMPDDIFENKNDLAYIRTRIAQRIDEMINNQKLSPHIREWDILNEITEKRDLETIFKADPNFTTGREIYQEIIRQVRAADPDIKLYINDYVVLSGGGSSSSVVNNYKKYLDEIHNSDADFDGIGFQCHIGSNPTSILKVESVFDEFYARYGKRQSVTEYDVSILVDPEVQAKYMADFLTMTFSHPSMDAFIMWGFWDGNHWKGNAPLFDLDWNLKPSGRVFLDKVFDEWWTNESIMSDSDGIGKVRAFKGRHRLTISKDNTYTSVELEVALAEDMTVEVDLTETSSIEDVYENDLQIVPNLVTEGYFSVEADDRINLLSLHIFGVSGVNLYSKDQIENGEQIFIDFDPGVYITRIQTNEGVFTRKIVLK